MATQDEEWFLLVEENGELPTGASKLLLSRVRSMARIWQSLGVRADDTNARCLFRRVILCIDIVDQEEPSIIGTLRVDHLDSSISAAWVNSSIAWEETDITQTFPKDAVSFTVEPADSANGIDEAVTWLEAQLRRPVHFLRWTQGGKTIARHWLLADTGRDLVVSGNARDRRRPADSVSQIRP
jgi:hypothetical protein